MESCKGYEEWSYAEFSSWWKNMQKVCHTLQSLQTALWLLGLLIVYGWKRKDTKPLFVTVIWVMLSITVLASIPLQILYNRITLLYHAGDKKVIKKLWPYYTILLIIVQVLVSVVHWIFAVQYLEVVLKLPLILDQRQEGIQKKREKVKRIIKALNIYFYLQLATWASLMFAFRDTKQEKSFFLFENLDFVNKVLPAILLIFAIMLFRRKIDRLRERTFFSREKLMRFHTVIFLVYVFGYLGNQTLQTVYSNAEEGSIQQCRLAISEYYFWWLIKVVNIATTVLFIYMSVMFSKPLTGYWENFLLIYRSEELSQALSKVGYQPTEQERAKRYFEAAVRDANRQINILMAFVETTEEEAQTTSLTANDDDDDLSSLRTNERSILLDSARSETSEQLFRRVWQEEVNRRKLSVKENNCHVNSQNHCA